MDIKLESGVKNSKSFNLSPKFSLDFSNSDKILKCAFSVTIDKSAPDEELPFELHAKIVSNFEIIANTHIKNLQIEASSFIYPYLRNLISSITSLSNITPYFLPIIDFEETLQQKKAEPNRQTETIIRVLDEEI
ncbi:MAG: protein-export chaperone SecB [Christensenellaceae bacterium]|jgi:preprotein translocase subunit SecB|nr:protein-export chaperone SecB [Christensenellaceae bacterium]